MKKVLLIACMFFLTSAYAALSPLNQSLTELQSVLNGAELSQKLPQSESIQFVCHMETGYLIFTNSYQMFVELQYIKQNRPGPRTYNLVFHEPTKLTAQ